MMNPDFVSGFSSLHLNDGCRPKIPNKFPSVRIQNANKISLLWAVKTEAPNRQPRSVRANIIAVTRATVCG